MQDKEEKLSYVAPMIQPANQSTSKYPTRVAQDIGKLHLERRTAACVGLQTPAFLSMPKTQLTFVHKTSSDMSLAKV